MATDEDVQDDCEDRHQGQANDLANGEAMEVLEVMVQVLAIVLTVDLLLAGAISRFASFVAVVQHAESLADPSQLDVPEFHLAIAMSKHSRHCQRSAVAGLVSFLVAVAQH